MVIKMRKILISSFMVISLIGCASTPSNSKEDSQETIRYASSPCFGACPIYSVEISPTGAVRFEGKQYTKVIGIRDFKVDPAVYKKLQQQLKMYRPATGTSLKTTQCEQTMTDQQSAYFSWKHLDGTETNLSHYMGCISPANNKLNQLIHDLPKLMMIEDLVRRS